MGDARGTNASPLRRLFDLATSRALQDAGIVFGGNVVAQGLSFVAGMVVMYHFRTPDLKPTYAMISLAMAVMSMFTSYALLGMNAGFIRFGALYLNEKPARANLIFRVNVEIKTAVGFLVSVAGAVAAGVLARGAFKAPELTWTVRLAFFGVLGGTLLDAMQVILQTHQRFVRSSLQVVSVQAARLAAIALMLVLGAMTGRRLIVVYILLPYLGALVGFALAPKEFLRARGSRGDVLREQARFSAWVILSAGCTILMARLGLFLVQNLTPDRDAVGRIVADLSAALTLVMPFKLAVTALATAFLPRVARITDTRHFWGYFVKATALSALLVAAMLPALWLVQPLIAWKMPEWLTSVTIFRWLAVSVFIDLLVVPASLVVYSLNKTWLGTILNAAQLAVFFIVGGVLIPARGGEGAAIAEVAVRLLGLVFMGALVPVLLRRRGRAERVAEKPAHD